VSLGGGSTYGDALNLDGATGCNRFVYRGRSRPLP